MSTLSPMTWGAVSMRDEDRTAQTSIQRCPDGRPFDGRTTAALERPERDCAARERSGADGGRAVLEGLAATLAAALDDLPGGLIVLDADGRAVHMNRAARAIVERGDGISVERSGAIVLASSGAARQLAALLHAIRAGDTDGGMLRAPRRHGRAHYTLLVSPRPLAPDVPGPDVPGPNVPGPNVPGPNVPGPNVLARAAVAGAMVLIHDPDRLRQPPRAMLRQVFGLTRREAELVGALVAGIGAAGFALQAGISLNTVRYHLKSIYAKVGVRGQTELMRTVMTTTAVLGGERHAALWRAARE